MLQIYQISNIKKHEEHNYWPKMVSNSKKNLLWNQATACESRFGEAILHDETLKELKLEKEKCLKIDHKILNLKAKKCQSLPKITIFATITEKNIIQVNLLLLSNCVTSPEL